MELITQDYTASESDLLEPSYSLSGEHAKRTQQTYMFLGHLVLLQY